MVPELLEWQNQHLFTLRFVRGPLLHVSKNYYVMYCVPCHMSRLHCAGCLLHAADAWDITTTTQQIIQTIQITWYEPVRLVCHHP